MPEFVLYNAPQSTCSQRVRYVLHTKGKDFEEHKLDLFKGDQLSPTYLAINPNGVVPTLLHNGVPITDSAVIIEYLEDILPDIVPLRPRDPLKVAEMRSMMRFIDELPTPAVRVPSYNIAFLPHFQAMSEDEFQTLADSKPLRREFLLKMGRTGFPKSEMDEALGRLRRSIDRMATWLRVNGGPWLMGRELTLADIAIMPVIVRMDDINLNGMWDHASEIAAWLAGLKATVPFTKTFYHGALLTEKYPHLHSLRKRA